MERLQRGRTKFNINNGKQSSHQEHTLHDLVKNIEPFFVIRSKELPIHILYSELQALSIYSYQLVGSQCCKSKKMTLTHYSTKCERSIYSTKINTFTNPRKDLSVAETINS